MKILVIGSGGRESALTYIFKKQGHQVWCIPGNPGTEVLAEPLEKNPDINDHQQLIGFAKDTGIDLTVVGPEQPLVDGIGDAFISAGLRLFGPTKRGAVLEGEKVWAKNFMVKYQIPTAHYVQCIAPQQAYNALDLYFDNWGGAVVKPSGLTAGKGVICCKNIADAKRAVKLIMEDKIYGSAGNTVIIEEMLEGCELSILALSDGKNIVSLLPSQDHKKLGEGDEGPNTGGVGAYAPTPFVTKDVQREIDMIIERTGMGLQLEGLDYRGVIYFGLMITRRGVKVLEYNCRFGDPEAQVVLPLIKSDLAELMVKCCEGELNVNDIEWLPKSACCVVMVAEGYPFTFPTGDKVTGLDSNDENILIFQAGTKRDSEGNIVTASGRVLGVTGLGGTLKEAIDKAYQGVSHIDFVSAYYRNDIGYQAFREDLHEHSTN